MTQDFIISIGLKEGEHKVSMDIKGEDFDKTSGTRIKLMISHCLQVLIEKEAIEPMIQLQ